MLPIGRAQNKSRLILQESIQQMKACSIIYVIDVLPCLRLIKTLLNDIFKTRLTGYIYE